MIDLLPDQAPATGLYPPFTEFYQLLEREVGGLAPAELDYRSDRWEWADWPIRRQVSHIASLHFRWTLLRWGDFLFPDGPPPSLDAPAVLEPPQNRWLDESRFWELTDLLDKVQEAFDLLRSVLQDRSMGDLRRLEISREMSPPQVVEWQRMGQAHPTGIYFDPDHPGISRMTLEGTIRHMYFEDVTHLYNIQRLKRAQGLPTLVTVPPVGYWTVAGWDRSEP